MHTYKQPNRLDVCVKQFLTICPKRVPIFNIWPSILMPLSKHPPKMHGLYNPQINSLYCPICETFDSEILKMKFILNHSVYRHCFLYPSRYIQMHWFDAFPKTNHWQKNQPLQWSNLWAYDTQFVSNQNTTDINKVWTKLILQQIII